jgi:hypothetical protein
MKERCIAEVAELADALASGASPRKGVQVQVLSSALLETQRFTSFLFRLLTSGEPL